MTTELRASGREGRDGADDVVAGAEEVADVVVVCAFPIVGRDDVADEAAGEAEADNTLAPVRFMS